MELTAEEVDLVLKHREEQAQVAEAQRMKLRVLGIASQYEAWLQTHNRGSSFSAFVNEFECDEATANLFKRVETVRAAAGPE